MPKFLKFYPDFICKLTKFAIILRFDMKRGFIFIAIILSLAVSCKRSGQTRYVPRPSDSVYTAKLARHIYPDNPQRALVVLDSAYIVGNVNEFERDLVRATIYGRQLIDPQKGKALEICQQLLQHDSTQTNSESSVKHRLDVLRLAADIYRERKDFENYLKYSLEIENLNRTWGYETEALRTEAEIAYALSKMGREEEGLNKMESISEALSKGAPSIDRLDAWIVVSKRKISLLSDMGRQADIIPLAQEIIYRLDYYQAHSADYAEDSFRLPPVKESRDRWCNYYRAQAHGLLAYSYAVTGNIKEARKEVAVFEQSKYGRTYGGRRMISRAWAALGEWDKVLAIDDISCERMGADTINADYALILLDYSEAAKARGRYRESREWLERYAGLKEKLSLQLQTSQAQEYAARYHEKEQEMAVAAAKAEMRRKDSMIFCILVLFVFAVFASFYYASQRRRIQEKNKVLVRLINEQAERNISLHASVSKPSAKEEELFRHIDTVIREERLFASPMLQRQDILDRFNLRRQTLNELMNTFADGKSFPAYINSIRMEEAGNLLRKNPGMPFTLIAESVGLNQSNFRIQFKLYYGMTPAEYRENM